VAVAAGRRTVSDANPTGSMDPWECAAFAEWLKKSLHQPFSAGAGKIFRAGAAAAA
jgi:hypothetical protein